MNNITHNMTDNNKTNNITFNNITFNKQYDFYVNFYRLFQTIVFHHVQFFDQVFDSVLSAGLRPSAFGC